MREGPIDGPEQEKPWKAGGDVCPTSTFPCLDSEHQNVRSSHVKNENADFGHGLADGEEREGNIQVTPAAGRALLQCYLPGSQLHSGRTKEASKPQSFEFISSVHIWIFAMNNTVEAWNGSLGCSSVF